MTYQITQEDVDEIFSKLDKKKFLLNLDKNKIKDLIKIRNEIIKIDDDEDFIIDEDVLDTLNITDTNYFYLNYKNIIDINVSNIKEIIDFNKNCNLKNDFVKIYSVIEDYNTFDDFCDDFIKIKDKEINKQKQIELRKNEVEINKKKREEIKHLNKRIDILEKLVKQLTK